MCFEGEVNAAVMINGLPLYDDIALENINLSARKLFRVCRISEPKIKCIARHRGFVKRVKTSGKTESGWRNKSPV